MWFLAMNKKYLLLGGLVLLVLLVGGAVVMGSGKRRDASPASAPMAPASAPMAIEAHDHTHDHATGTDETANETPVRRMTYDNAVTTPGPLGERSLGNPDAPVRIEELASLSCGHCATFHKAVLPDLKERFIDTGIVYFTYTDFPLNAPALDGAMIARCMPEDRYFRFMSMLFEMQEQWAFNQDYRNILRQNAALAGMDDETFESCLNDQELKEGLIARMQDRQSNHNINSTPSFIVNGTRVLTGMMPVAAFEQAINEALAQGQQQDATPQQETEE